jgi:hypothetical protein
MSALQDAYTLQSKISHKYESNKIINELISSINVYIRDAVKEKKSSIVYKLPSQFDIHKLDHKKSQTLIYGSLIKRLDEKHYDVKIKITNKNSTDVVIGKTIEGAWLHISWKDCYEDVEFDDLDDLIKSKSTR